MTPRELERLMDERARLLAYIVLSRHPDLSLTRSPWEAGSGLGVQVQPIDRADPVQFQVLARYTLIPTSVDEVDDRLRTALPPGRAVEREAGPVGVLFFTMSDADRAYFCWLQEPDSRGGNASLIRHDSPSCVPATRETIESIVHQVQTWHDAHRPILSA